jgi:surfeit locus 1 family protein
VEAPRSAGSLVAIAMAALLAILGLLALGTWQVHRLAWKLDLIARVDARVHAPPVPPPGPAAWPDVTAERDEYRHVVVRGTFRNDRETLVQAVTEQGPGFWVMTPLVTDGGFTVLINRGFVPSDRRDPATRAAGQIAGPTTVTGLLRVTEPGGSFLRSNDPAGDHWYSRDVAAIAIKRGLGPVAPYFIDQDATPKPGRYPVGGLTVISFPNNHLVYALTWYGLAVLLGGATVWIGRDEWRRRTPASLSIGPSRS